MNFAIEHPCWFLGICAVLVLNAHSVYKSQRFLASLETNAVVLQFPERGGEEW